MRYGVGDLFLAVIICFVLGFAGVSTIVPTRPHDGIEILKADYGERWPFNVTRGWLRCEGAGAIILNVQGTDYAVNGLASSRYAPIHAVWKSKQADDISAGPIISRGLTLCSW
jgi:hypothetical protein